MSPHTDGRDAASTRIADVAGTMAGGDGGNENASRPRLLHSDRMANGSVVLKNWLS